MRWTWLALPILAVTAAACGPDQGSVEVLAWGEDEATEGFGADETDGWNVSFDHWIVGFSGVELSDPQSGDVLVGSDPFVVDFAQHADPVAVATVEADAGRLDFGWATAVPTAGTGVDPIDTALVDGMISEGAVHRVVGSANDGTTTVTFDWTFANPVVQTLCENGDDGTQGLAVPADDTASAMLTLHTDHLLWDQLGTEEANLGFAVLAGADADADGVVTMAELEAVSTLEAGFETGGFDLPTVADFLEFGVARAVHLNGAGGCLVSAGG